jgi:hypothetical protein
MSQDLPFPPGTPMEGGYFAGVILLLGVPHGIVVAPRDLGQILDAPWHTQRELVPGADSCFDGLANTLAMAEVGSDLARRILALQGGNHRDWYLPARDELELAYRHLKPTAEENDCSFRDGDNPSSRPAGYPYTATTPAQTSAELFREGGAEAFEARWHWSSTQYSRYDAWGQYFDGGGQDGGDKSWQGGAARAFRRFVLQ